MKVDWFLAVAHYSRSRFSEKNTLPRFLSLRIFEQRRESAKRLNAFATRVRVRELLCTLGIQWVVLRRYVPLTRQKVSNYFFKGNLL
jgi:hypothetical protein